MNFWDWLFALSGISAGYWTLGYLMGRDSGRRARSRESGQ